MEFFCSDCNRVKLLYWYYILFERNFYPKRSKETADENQQGREFILNFPLILSLDLRELSDFAIRGQLFKASLA